MRQHDLDGAESLAKKQFLMPQQCLENRCKVDDHCKVHVVKTVTN